MELALRLIRSRTGEKMESLAVMTVLMLPMDWLKEEKVPVDWQVEERVPMFWLGMEVPMFWLEMEVPMFWLEKEVPMFWLEREVSDPLWRVGSLSWSLPRNLCQSSW